MGEMIFNGTSTKDMGVVIQTPPVYEFPTKDYTVVHVEGKTGDVVIDNGSYQNVKRTYYLASVFRPNTSFVSNATAIVAWLIATSGYCRLEDSYESDYFRMALFRSAGEMVNMYDIATTLPVTFECKPQRYLKSGEVQVTIAQVGEFIRIINLTNYISLPEITIEAVDAVIQFYAGADVNNPDNTSEIEIEFDVEGVIDSELQDCYVGSTNVNELVSLTNGFPKLYPGVNWVKVSATSLQSFKIKPRWWTL